MLRKFVINVFLIETLNLIFGYRVRCVSRLVSDDLDLHVNFKKEIKNYTV